LFEVEYSLVAVAVYPSFELKMNWNAYKSKNFRERKDERSEKQKQAERLVKCIRKSYYLGCLKKQFILRNKNTDLLRKSNKKFSLLHNFHKKMNIKIKIIISDRNSLNLEDIYKYPPQFHQNTLYQAFLRTCISSR